MPDPDQKLTFKGGVVGIPKLPAVSRCVEVRCHRSHAAARQVALGGGWAVAAEV